METVAKILLPRKVGCPILSPDQQCLSTDGKIVHHCRLSFTVNKDSSYLQNISPRIVFVCPAEAEKDLKYFVVLEDAEEAVHQDLQSYRGRLRAVQHQAGDVEYDVRLDDFVGGCRAGGGPRRRA